MNKLGGIYVIANNEGVIMQMDSGIISWRKESSAKRALNIDISKNIIYWYDCKNDSVPEPLKEGYYFEWRHGIITGRLGGELIDFNKRSEILPYLLARFYKIVYIERLHV